MRQSLGPSTAVPLGPKPSCRPPGSSRRSRHTGMRAGSSAPPREGWEGAARGREGLARRASTQRLWLHRLFSSVASFPAKAGQRTASRSSYSSRGKGDLNGPCIVYERALMNMAAWVWKRSLSGSGCRDCHQQHPQHMFSEECKKQNELHSCTLSAPLPSTWGTGISQTMYCLCS